LLVRGLCVSYYVREQAELLDDVLVVNTLRHTRSGRPGGEFRVEVRCSADTVRVAVTDQGGPAEPVSGAAGRFDECGRGLRTVSALAEAGAGTATATAVRSRPSSPFPPRRLVRRMGETPGETMACAKIK
jgi:hypothetical protein